MDVAASKKNDDLPPTAKVGEAPSSTSSTSTNKVVRRKPYSVTKTKDIIIEASKKAPEKMQPYIRFSAWIIAYIGLLFTLIQPTFGIIIAILKRLYKVIEPFHPENLLEAIAGLFMCFYGGCFFLIVASAEAWRAASWEQNKHDLKVIYEDFIKVQEANKKDAQVDKDGNGIADVDELDATHYFMRKVNLCLVSVNPETLSAAMGNLYMAFIAIVAALRVRFARAVALGNSLGDIAAGPAKRVFAPVLRALLPQDYKKWAAPVIGFIVKFAAIQVAWTLQRIISTVHSAVRGGFLFARGILAYLRKERYIKLKDEDTYLDEVVGIILAVLGFFFQTSTGWTLPFPVNIFMLPFTLTETFLSYYVAK